MGRRSRSYHHGDLRQALIRAAVRVVAETGTHDVRVSSLAKELGVSSAAPFRHFASKQALLVAAAEEGAEAMLAAMQGAMEGVEDPLDAQRAGAVAYVRFAAEQPGYFRLVSDLAVMADSERIQEMNAGYQGVMDAVLGRGQQGEVTPALLRRSAGMLAAQALVYGLACMITDGSLGPLSGDDAARLAWEATGVLGRGLGSDE